MPSEKALRNRTIIDVAAYVSGSATCWEGKQSFELPPNLHDRGMLLACICADISCMMDDQKSENPDHLSVLIEFFPRVGNAPPFLLRMPWEERARHQKVSGILEWQIYWTSNGGYGGEIKWRAEERGTEDVGARTGHRDGNGRGSDAGTGGRPGSDGDACDLGMAQQDLYWDQSSEDSGINLHQTDAGGGEHLDQ